MNPTEQSAVLLLRHLDDPQRADQAAWSLLQLADSVSDTPLAAQAEVWRDRAHQVYSQNTEAVRTLAVEYVAVAERAPTRAARVWAAAQLEKLCERVSAWRAGRDAARRAQIRGWEDLVATVRAGEGVSV